MTKYQYFLQFFGEAISGSHQILVWVEIKTSALEVEGGLEKFDGRRQWHLAVYVPPMYLSLGGMRSSRRAIARALCRTTGG